MEYNQASVPTMRVARFSPQFAGAGAAALQGVGPGDRKNLASLRLTVFLFVIVEQLLRSDVEQHCAGSRKG